MTAPRLPEGVGTVSLDLAFADGPRLADEAGAEPSAVDLGTQRGRRHPESGCRLSEGEHGLLRGDGVAGAMLAPLAASDVSGRALGVQVAPLGGDADGRLHLGDEFCGEAGLVKEFVGLGGHLLLLVLSALAQHLADHSVMFLGPSCLTAVDALQLPSPADFLGCHLLAAVHASKVDDTDEIVNTQSEGFCGGSSPEGSKG